MIANVKVVDLEGKELKSLPFEAVEDDLSKLFAQYLRVLSFGERFGQAKAKTRGEGSGGGKKPWKQKGTGRARQGSIRSPIWKGGGAAHGPVPHEYTLKFNKSYMPKVWAYVLSQAAQKDNGWLVLKAEEKGLKTKAAWNFLKKFSKEGRNTLLVSEDAVLRKAFRNIDGLNLGRIEDLNPRDVSVASVLITSEKDFDNLNKKAKATAYGN